VVKVSRRCRDYLEAIIEDGYLGQRPLDKEAVKKLLRHLVRDTVKAVDDRLQEPGDAKDVRKWGRYIACELIP
jgi:hypothetical protein